MRMTAYAGLRSQTQEPDKGKRRDDLRSPPPSLTTHKNGIVAMYNPPTTRFQESHHIRPPCQRASPQSEGDNGNAPSNAMAEEATREEDEFLAPSHLTPKQHHLNQLPATAGTSKKSPPIHPATIPLRGKDDAEPETGQRTRSIVAHEEKNGE